jgi:hypothetical protein
MENPETVVPPGLFSEDDRKPPSLFAWLLWGLAVVLYACGMGVWIWLS